MRGRPIVTRVGGGRKGRKGDSEEKKGKKRVRTQEKHKKVLKGMLKDSD